MVPRLEFNRNHQAVAAGQTDVKLGTGQLGDILERLVINVITAGATGIASIKDGAGGASIPIISANTPLGAHSVKIGAGAKGATGAAGWHITTGAGASLLAVGDFKSA